MNTAEPSYYGGGILTTGEDEFAEKKFFLGRVGKTYSGSWVKTYSGVVKLGMHDSDSRKCALTDKTRTL